MSYKSSSDVQSLAHILSDNVLQKQLIHLNNHHDTFQQCSGSTLTCPHGAAPDKLIVAHLLNSTPSHPVSSRIIFISSRRLPGSLQVFRQHFVCIFHRSHACYIPRPCYPLTTSGEVQTTELPSMQLLAVSPAPCSSV